MIRPPRRDACPIAILLAIVGAGCGSTCSSNKGDDDKADQSNVPRTSSVTSAKSRRAQVFAALVAHALTCEWRELRGFLPRCRKLKRLWRSDIGMDETLLLGLLDDNNPRKRWICAAGLRRGRAYQKDAKVATRIVGAMETEADRAVALALADAISRIHLKKLKLTKRVSALVRTHPVVLARLRLVKHALFYNRRQLYDLVVELARGDKQLLVRRAAIAALFTGTPTNRHADSCKLWHSVTADPAPKISAIGSAYLTRYGRGLCRQYYDAVLARIAKRAAAGKVKAERLADSLRNLYYQPAATPKLKKRSLAVALTLLKNTNNYGPSRARALELLNKNHPRGKQLVALYLKDKDGFVMRRAERLSRTKNR